MKKILTTAFILGSLYGTAQAATITSPIYMPSSGELVNSLSVGYTRSDFDSIKLEGVGQDDEFERSWNIDLNGKFGFNENLSLNYGFAFDFNREVYKTDQSAMVTDFYLGLTGRVIDSNENKLDILLNVGQGANKYWPSYNKDQIYADLSLRYGLDLNAYNVAFSVGSKFTSKYEEAEEKIDRESNFYVKLENEIIFSEQFTMGVDLFYSYNPRNNYNDGLNNQYYKSFNEYGFNVDLNYALNENNYIGIFFGMVENDIEQFEIDEDGDLWETKDLTEYKGGIRLTSRF